MLFFDRYLAVAAAPPILLATMKLALSAAQLPIEANAEAPHKARCLHCGAPVVLRRRRRSSRPNDETYFWRHCDHNGTPCPAKLVAGRIKTPIQQLR